MDLNIFLNLFRFRDFWCENFYKDIMNQSDLVKDILLEQKYFTYDNYENEHDIIDIIDQRLNGAESIILELTESEFESSIVKKFMKLDLKIRKYFGIDISNESNNYHNQEKYISKKLEIIFHEIRDLEIKTVKREVKRLKSEIDTHLGGENVNFKLYNKNLKEICHQLDILKSGLERCKELDIEKKKLQMIGNMNMMIVLNLEELLKKVNDAKNTRDHILRERMSAVIDEIGKVQHNGDWIRNSVGIPNWSCCNNRYYYSSCTNTKRRMY